MNKMVVKNGKKKSKSSSSYHLNLSKCNITCFKSITLARSKIINFEEFKYSFTQALQQNVFLVTKISEEIFFVTKNTALVTKYEFRH